ncbi:IS1595 family transposase [Mucilaginibacter panaciglaebae]|uniref:IS1595 family transposase n=1 Tax=Mucilaginibacter panaciglaebae TaxID=502331 RepID=A0ABP7WYX9_9SPHI
MTSQFTSLLQVLDFFKEETTCISYLAHSRWGNEPSCPHCGNVGAYVTNRGYKCKAKECHKKFTVTMGTIFENTKISLRIWFAAMYLCTAHRKGISSLQLSRDLNITQKTAWFLLHRIREMLNDWGDDKLSGVIEVDETYVGGSLKNKSNKKRRAIRHANEQWGGVKTAIFALVEREGQVRTVMLANKKAKLIDVLPIIEANVDKDAQIYTDSSSMYGSLKNTYKHEQVNHVQHEYVRGSVHTNTIEGFFSLLKRGVIGIYHYVSPKHLHRYCREFEYRYNNRKMLDVDRFEAAFKIANNKRLTYHALISNK